MNSEEQNALDEVADGLQAYREAKANAADRRSELVEAIKQAVQLGITVGRIADHAGTSTGVINNYLGRRPKPAPRIAATTDEFEAAWAALTERETP